MKWNVGIFKVFALYYCIETKLWLDSIISCFSKVSSFRIQVKLENNSNLKGKFTKLDWNGLVWKNQMEPLQFQSIFKIVMVTQSIPGLVGLIGLISPRLDWLLIRCFLCNCISHYLIISVFICYRIINPRIWRPRHSSRRTLSSLQYQAS